MYNYTFFCYSLGGKKLSAYSEYNIELYFYKVGLLIFLFLAYFYISLGIIRKKNFKIKKNKSFMVVILNIIVMIYFIVTGINGKIADYREIELSPKIEYLIIPYIIIYIFSPKRKYIKLVNFFLILFCIYLLFLGTRSPAIQIFILLIILNNEILKKYRDNKGIFFITMGISVMKIVEKLRVSPNGILDRINYLLEQKSDVIVNNEADVLYVGAAIIGLLEKKLLTLKDSLYSFIAIIFNFFRLDFLKEYSVLPLVVEWYTPIGGGGIISTNLYYYAREIGVIVVAIFLGKILKRLFKAKNNIFIIYSLIVYVTFIRWYAYSIITIYKISLYGIIYYMLNISLYSILKKEKRK